MKKGFTLIEVLAAIIILGVILIISVPVVNNLIEKGRLDSFKASVMSVFHSYNNYAVNNNYNIPNTLDIKDIPLTSSGFFTSGTVARDVNDIVMVYKLTNGVYCATGTKEDLEIIKGDCYILDSTPPIIISISANSTTSSITLYTSYKEDESFLVNHEYRFAKANENFTDNWIKGDSLTENLSTKTFSNLSFGTDYKFQVRLTNVAGTNNQTISNEFIFSTLNINKPVISLITTKEYAVSKDIKITFPSNNNLTHSYSIDNGASWTSSTSLEEILTINENTTIKARSYDGVNYVYADFLTISGIDKTVPVITITNSVISNKNVLTVNVTPITTPSGYSYEWYKDGVKINGATSTTYTTSESGSFKVKVITGAGREVISEAYKINSYIVTYNFNGGTGTINSQEKVEGIDLTLTSTTPTKAGSVFLGWGLSSASTEVTYTSGGTYVNNENITLYAIWQVTYFYCNESTIGVNGCSKATYYTQYTCTQGCCNGICCDSGPASYVYASSFINDSTICNNNCKVACLSVRAKNRISKTSCGGEAYYHSPVDELWYYCPVSR